MYHFIVNPHSQTGKGKKIWETLQEEIERRKVQYTVHYTKHAGHATELSREIAKTCQGVKTIIIVGGDGTANEVINGIDDFSDIIFGYIPTGSSNDLARGLNLKLKPMEALDHVLSPKRIKYVDYGSVTYKDGTFRKHFFVSSGIGYDADICYDALTSPIKLFLNRFHLGKFTYIAIAVKQILSNRPFQTTAIFDGMQKRTIENTVFIASMNHRYEGGGLPMAPNADFTDGELNVCIVNNFPKYKIFLLMPTIFFGKHILFKGVELVKCRSIELITDRPVTIHADGEYGGTKEHITVTCHQRKLRFLL